MATNNLISRIRKWPIEKKRIFSILVAVFLTILIIVLNSALNIIWKDETKNIPLNNKNSPINTIQESFSKIFSEAKPILDQAFGSSTSGQLNQTGEIIDQINSTSSSFSTTSNIVE